MVVVDGAPGLGVSDAAPLMREVGAVLVVSRVGPRPDTHESQALRDRLELLGVRPLGVVANRVSRRAGTTRPGRWRPSRAEPARALRPAAGDSPARPRSP
jgi:Mrp family chromosome partitioning ATPase